MKKLSVLMLSALVMTLSFIGCKKDGETGPAGPAGANGTNGNANVKVLYYTIDTLKASNAYSADFVLGNGVTQNMVDSSLVLVYYSYGTLWYASPGLGYSNQYQTRNYTYAVGTDVYMFFGLYDVDGSSYTGPDQYLSRIKVIVAPADIFTGRGMKVDTKDYYATMRYLGLKAE